MGRQIHLFSLFISGGDELLTVKLRYKSPQGDASKLLSFPVTDKGMELSDAPEDFRFAAAVACFGLVLRESERRGDATFELALELARSGKGEDPDGYRSEFLQLVQLAKALAAEN